MRPASHASKRSKFNSTVSHAVVCTVASEYRDSAFDSKMARFIAQMILVGAQAVGRAFSQALRQEYQASMAARRAAEEAGRDGAKASKANTYTGLTLQEAKQILNVQNLEDVDGVRKNYEHLFRVNDKTTGGSFYLQSKIVRAKERVELELDKQIVPDPEPKPPHENTESESDSSSKPS